MAAHLWELADLIARWIHVIAGIMWIGNSLLYNWIDRNLRPRPEVKGSYGDIWLLHSGGFYLMEKTSLAGQTLPKPLHWFKWQAYTTWLSGASLLIIVYYIGRRAALVDPTVSSLTHLQGMAVAIGSLVGTWIVYDIIWRYIAPHSSQLAAALSIAGLVALDLVLMRYLGGRAAYLHMGAALASIMAANVFFVIMPSQHDLVSSVADGRGADPVIAGKAKTRSIHNNYLTFPALVLMVSGHFAGIYGHRYAWLLLLVLIFGGATIRHILNVRFTWPQWKPALAAAIATTAVLLSVLSRTPSSATAEAASALSEPLPAQVTFADVRPIIDRRCAACHSASPADVTFGPSPSGVAFDTPAQMQQHAARIKVRAVETKTMPLGNKTHITDRERAMLGQWVDAGAPIQ